MVQRYDYRVYIDSSLFLKHLLIYFVTGSQTISESKQERDESLFFFLYNFLLGVLVEPWSAISSW